MKVSVDAYRQTEIMIFRECYLQKLTLLTKNVTASQFVITNICIYILIINKIMITTFHFKVIPPKDDTEYICLSIVLN